MIRHYSARFTVPAATRTYVLTISDNKGPASYVQLERTFRDVFPKIFPGVAFTGLDLTCALESENENERWELEFANERIARFLAVW